jgi:hypothetical protein
MDAGETREHTGGVQIPYRGVDAAGDELYLEQRNVDLGYL